MTLREHVPLAPLTTFGIGGPARYFSEARTIEEIHEGIEFARKRGVQLFILGGGSNILIADAGFEGLVLKVEIAGITTRIRGASVEVRAGAGVAWDDLVAQMVASGYAGLESMSGVPGTVGGGVVANIGCYGAQVSDTFISARVIDTGHPERGAYELKKEECGFSYHDSLFSRSPGRYLVLEATFALAAHADAQPLYTDSRFDLAALSAKNGRTPTIADVRAAVLAVREEKGTLAGSYKSAGSFFHMPFVSPGAYAHVRARARELDEKKEERLRPWAWPQPDGSYKLAPGFLLEYTEFQKGYVRDSVGISPKHTLTIINRSRAYARDIAEVAEDMRAAVQEIFSVDLEREVAYVGAV